MLQVLYLSPRFLLSRLCVFSSPSAALHPSQAAEGAQRGLAKGMRRGIAARTQAHAVPFRYAGR
jgi:hypothetical protein